MIEGLKEKVENGIKNIAENGIEREELDTLYKLVDIHKDLANEEYWEKKKEVMEMNYRGYGNYDREEYGRRQRDSRGRYMARGRGRGMYGTHEPMDEMYEAYQEYSEGREEYNRGNYGAKEDTMKSLEYMLEAGVDFFEKLKQDASSQEEMQMIKHYAKKISEML